MMMMKKRKKKMGCSKSLLTFFAVALWLLGCTIIGYMAWVLATSVTVKQFMSGNLVFTYAVIGVGFSLFITGLMGWVGSSSLSECLLKLYIFATVVSIATEVGGIITLNILRLELDDIIQQGWYQVNQDTRNVVQKYLQCCGYNGPKEFAYNNDPIDETCYEPVALPSDVLTTLTSMIGMDPTRPLKQEACGARLRLWLEDNKVIWVSILAGIGLLELLGVICAVYLVNRVQNLRRTESSDELGDHRRIGTGKHSQRNHGNVYTTWNSRHSDHDRS